MKKKEKIAIGVLIAITIIAIIALMIMNNKGGKSASKKNETKSTENQFQYCNSEKGML